MLQIREFNGSIVLNSLEKVLSDTTLSCMSTKKNLKLIFAENVEEVLENALVGVENSDN